MGAGGSRGTMARSGHGPARWDSSSSTRSRRLARASLRSVAAGGAEPAELQAAAVYALLSRTSEASSRPVLSRSTSPSGSARGGTGPTCGSRRSTRWGASSASTTLPSRFTRGMTGSPTWGCSSQSIPGSGTPSTSTCGGDPQARSAGDTVPRGDTATASIPEGGITRRPRWAGSGFIRARARPR
jgi:hypothetical protein